ncbi:hypothetical protein CFAM422_010688 [Trichoderma lentiforme]|uniref:Uncharacterized protein n=1 Tax=Trichoderma lentiforme TaxID=1567552 RepID=A0A9P5C809_9HYPO|nr:hypothetical protein CFAM422_010688 [Trichoderma lentiforme]
MAKWKILKEEKKRKKKNMMMKLQFVRAVSELAIAFKQSLLPNSDGDGMGLSGTIRTRTHTPRDMLSRGQKSEMPLCAKTKHGVPSTHRNPVLSQPSRSQNNVRDVHLERPFSAWHHDTVAAVQSLMGSDLFGS